MLSIDNLGKRYGDHIVFQGLTHVFTPGCFALCDEDSTGKSTLLALIAGALALGEGDVHIDGHSLRWASGRAMARLAYVPDDCLMFPTRTGRELLGQVAAEKGAVLDDSVLGIARDLELEPHLDKPFEQMSTGTRRKVFLAAAALGEPAAVIADGPTKGVDAKACAVLADLFRAWSQDRVVLFASHDPDFVRACGARAMTVGSLR